MDYRKRLHELIPGGAHTYSRGDDQYPENAPPILARGQGCYVWDPAGNRYLDYGMALRAVTVGYGHPAIAEAAIAEIKNGNNLTRASVTELRAAETMVELVPAADMVKFGKNGSTVTSAAVKLARAYTGRKYIAICAEHPFFSYDDWFIGATVMDRGVPQEHKSLTLKFHFNDIGSLEALFSAHPGQIAAVMLEPATTVEPRDSFLQKVQDLCRRNGAVFVLDEMITGFRWHLQGAQKMYGLQPDLSTFGKGMANGFSVAALTGRREIMEIGGISRQGEDRVFLISTTHGAEMCGLGAFLKTVEVYREEGVVQHLWDYGRKLGEGLNALASELGISRFFQVEGPHCSPAYVTRDSSNVVSLEMRTLFSQEMIANGVLMPWIALSRAHGPSELEMTLSAARKALGVYAKALEGGPQRFLRSRPIRPVFRKTN